MQQAVPAIAVQGNARVEILALHGSIRPSPAEGFKQLFLAPPGFPDFHAGGDNLLGENIQRRPRLRCAVQFAPSHCS